MYASYFNPGSHTRYAKRNRLHTLDSASERGMTVTDSLDYGRMYLQMK